MIFSSNEYPTSVMSAIRYACVVVICDMYVLLCMLHVCNVVICDMYVCYYVLYVCCICVISDMYGYYMLYLDTSLLYHLILGSIFGAYLIHQCAGVFLVCFQGPFLCHTGCHYTP